MKKGFVRIVWVFVVVLLSLLVVSQAAEQGEPIVYFDMSGLNALDRSRPEQARRAWDTMHMVSSLQGIVNRDAPRLFVRFYTVTDDFWLEELRKEGHWLAGRPLETVTSVNALLKRFEKNLKGVVFYTDGVYATSNLASTIAGVEDRLCVRFDRSMGSVCADLMQGDFPFLRDEVRLFHDDGSPLFTGKGTILQTNIPSSGSAKCDAYLWAMNRYLEPGKCSAEYLAYYIDSYWLAHPTKSGLGNNTLTNHDFFIAKKAFFFDLNVWEEEVPVDDLEQQPGTDLRVLRQMMLTQYKRAGGEIVHIGGFTPWAWKYTDYPGAGGKHDGVDTEWKYAQIISQYNGIMDADALGYSGMANASFYMHFPLQEKYEQNPRPTDEDLRTRGFLKEDGTVAPYTYMSFYMGDYDSAAWLQIHVPKWWSDPARGTIPCNWAFNPNLDKRAPHVLDYARRNQLASDWFIAGDSGAGYLNPGMLSAANRTDAGTEDGWEKWTAHNAAYYSRYSLDITGFIIEGHAPGMGERGLDYYARFSPGGLVGQKLPQGQGVYKGGMPYTFMQRDLDGRAADAGQLLAETGQGSGAQFQFIRTILKSPSWHKATMERATELNAKIRFVDAYTFFSLLKKSKLPLRNIQVFHTVSAEFFGAVECGIGGFDSCFYCRVFF